MRPSTRIVVIANAIVLICNGVWAQAPRPAATETVKRAVTTFYNVITKYKPLGIPKGKAKQSLWPLLSSRLAHKLDALQACEDDYVRQNGETDARETLKPSISWLELGLFSGDVEAADPSRFAIMKIVPRSGGSFAVHLRFWHLQTYADYLHLPPQEDGPYKGIAIVVPEGGRYLIDDFMVLDDKTKMPVYVLSHGFADCKGDKWVGTD